MISCKHCATVIDYFSHIPISHLAMYCIIFVGDVNELMFTMTCSTGKKSTVCRPNITA